MKRQDDARSNASRSNQPEVNAMVAKFAVAHRQARQKDSVIKKHQKSPRAVKEREFLTDFALKYQDHLIRAGQYLLSSIGAHNPQPEKFWVDPLLLTNMNSLRFALRKLFPISKLHGRIYPPNLHSSFSEWTLSLNDQHYSNIKLSFKLKAVGEKLAVEDLSRSLIHIEIPNPRIEADEQMLRFILRQSLLLGSRVRQLTGAMVKMRVGICAEQDWADEQIRLLQIDSVEAEAKFTDRALLSSLAYVELLFDTPRSASA